MRKQEERHGSNNCGYGCRTVAGAAETDTCEMVSSADRACKGS